VVTKAVVKHGGVVDKFVGDSVMALWGVPERRINDELSAVRAAIDIRTGLCELNSKRAESGLFRLEAGVGVHCGPAIFGAVGNGQRVDYTVIGSTINVAARIQSLTKRFLFDVVISSELQAIVKDYTLVENVGEVRIRGVAEAVGLVKLIGVSMVDGEFVIGRQDLEAAVSVKAAGTIAGMPATLSVPENTDVPPIVGHDSDKAA
jgi:adenylate cyclase